MGECEVECWPEVAGELIYHPNAENDIKETNQNKRAETHAESPGTWVTMPGSLAQAVRSCAKRPRSDWDWLLLTSELDPREAASDCQRNNRDDCAADSYCYRRPPQTTHESRQRRPDRCRTSEDGQVDTHHAAAQPIRRIRLDGGIRQGHRRAHREPDSRHHDHRQNGVQSQASNQAKR